MKIFTRIFNIAVGLLTAAVITIGGMTAVPKIFGYLPCVILSGSMYPALETGSIAFIDSRNTECEIGDIIAYRLAAGRDEEKLVTHRIVGRRHGGYVTRGDANDVEDTNLVQPDQIVGICRFHIPGLGYLQARITPKVKRLAAVWTVFLNLSVCLLSFLLEAEADTGKSTKPAPGERTPESHKA